MSCFLVNLRILKDKLGSSEGRIDVTTLTDKSGFFEPEGIQEISPCGFFSLESTLVHVSVEWLA